jgi:hypothetical protein
MREICSFNRSDFPLELHLILACLRITPNEMEVQQIEKLSKIGINWHDFLMLVDRHLVAPLVYHNLSSYARRTIPDSIMNKLRSRFERNAHRSLVNATELVRLGKLFQENDIPFIPLKGSILALQVYGNLALRHAGDIDLLVDQNHLDRADRLLQVDYRRTMPAFRLTSSQHRRFLRLMLHFEYLHDQRNLCIELHWRSIHNKPPHVMDLTQLHSRASTVAVAGFRLPATPGDPA